MMTKVCKLFSLLFLFSSLTFANTGEEEEPNSECNCNKIRVAPQGSLYQCHKTKNRCKLVRKGVNYAFEWTPSSPKYTKLKISAAKGKFSNIVYSCKVRVMDNRRTTGEYIIKVPYSYYKGYTWEDRNLKDAVIIKYNVKDQQYTFEAVGKMKDYKSVFEGNRVETYLKRKSFSPQQMMRAGAVLLIMDYNQAMRQS